MLDQKDEHLTYIYKRNWFGHFQRRAGYVSLLAPSFHHYLLLFLSLTNERSCFFLEAPEKGKYNRITRTSAWSSKDWLGEVEGGRGRRKVAVTVPWVPRDSPPRKRSRKFPLMVARIAGFHVQLLFVRIPGLEWQSSIKCSTKSVVTSNNLQKPYKETITVVGQRRFRNLTWKSWTSLSCSP